MGRSPRKEKRVYEYSRIGNPGFSEKKNHWEKINVGSRKKRGATEKRVYGMTGGNFIPPSIKGKKLLWA